ncbi:hypothetical protein [Streptomyces pratensis]|uniref:hypothetical protein n=1 Tax=Streptomyces pratensis TaxID=1169025 RepID=UPI0030178E77
MPRWGLLVEQNLGYGGQRRVWSAEVLTHVAGTREEALTALRKIAEGFRPIHPSSPKRRRLYRERDGFLLVLDGAWQSFHCRFTAVEQLADSAAPAPEPAPEPQAAPKPPRPVGEDPSAPEPQAAPKPPPPAPERPAPRPTPGPGPAWDAEVPEVPSWFGRTDLA